MVVSEMGARLSPKMAPLTIAPTTTAGLAPTVVATGSSTGRTATMAPLEVPQAVEISAQMMKPTSGRKPALRPSSVTSQVRPWIRPLWRSSWERTPASRNAKIMTHRVSFFRPATTAFSNSFLSLASRKAVHRPAKPAMQNRTRETFCKAAMVIISAMNTNSGRHAPKVPP